MKKIISQGAEAVLFKEKNTILKKRIPKNYRHPDLDKEIIKLRTRHESKILEDSSKIIPVPKIIKTSLDEIKMDFINGEKLSVYLDKAKKQEQTKILKQFGKNLALLHNNGIIHNDLTTSNMIWHANSKKLYFIDFGLSFYSVHAEHKAVDLHLLKQALESKHSKNFDFYLKEILLSYKKHSNDFNRIIKRLEKVEKRGRYKRKH